MNVKRDKKYADENLLGFSVFFSFGAGFVVAPLVGAVGALGGGGGGGGAAGGGGGGVGAGSVGCRW